MNKPLLTRAQRIPLTAVGLGPGDPDLLTLKGLKTLQKAQVIFYPATLSKDGSFHSYALRILEAHSFKARLSPLIFSMQTSQRTKDYDSAWLQIKKELDKDKAVCVVSEGDLMLYSTFGNLLSRAKAANYPCNLVPGITSWLHAGALAQNPLVQEQESLYIIAAPNSIDEVNRKLAAHSCVVVMKPARLNHAWSDHLAACDRPFFYIEHAGMPEQFFTHDAGDLKNRTMPYFSLLIFFPKKRNTENQLK